MACLGISHGGITDNVIRKQPVRVSGSTHLSVKVSNLRPSTSINSTTTCASGHRSGLSVFSRDIDLQTKCINNNTFIESPRVSESLDDLIHTSVSEIVKNIKQAPLLVQIYTNGEVKTTKASHESHGSSLSSLLAGVILVEELADEYDGAKAYGVLIQGKVKRRDDKCRSSCYLLKTSSVNGGDLGCCTLFCLMKVRNFHENVFKQFRDSWLVQMEIEK